MKRTVIVIALAVLAAASLSCSRKQEQAPARTDPVTPAERLGYAIGMEVGDSLRSIGAELDVAAFVQGVQDTFSGAEPALTPQQATEVKTAFMQKRQAEIERSMKELADRNLAEGKAFLEENKTREGVVATTSGLQYAVLQDGEGPQPGPDDRIKVHFPRGGSATHAPAWGPAPRPQGRHRADAGRQQVPVLPPAGAGLWRAEPRAECGAELDAGLRGRAARREPA
jgi:hypothetical protein